MAKICHMTDAHPRYDIRIFEKECKSLAKIHELNLVVSDDQPDETIESVRIVSTGYVPKNRIQRIVVGNYRVYKKALSLDCDVYHLHDPELLFFALKLKRKGKKVIFDSHENVPGQIFSKDWLPLRLRSVISKVYKCFETAVVKRIDAVVAATPYIGTLFESRAKMVAVVNNYPKLDDVKFQGRPFEERENDLCYAGNISEIRGEKTMQALASAMKRKLIIAGSCPEGYAEEHSNEYVTYVGNLDRTGVNDLYSKSKVGLVLLHPTKNYIDSLPIKMFEYMAAGLPFVASDFPLWKDITEEYNSGICVDPLDIEKISDACLQLLDNPEQSKAMGLQGRKAIEEKYNWSIEEKKLIEVYENAIS